MTIETILTPAELPALACRDLRTSACVVFDILRATSTFVTALQNGAREIVPVSEIPEAVARRRAQPDVLLAGERDGVRIRAAAKRHLAGPVYAETAVGTRQAGSLSEDSEIDFDFGNSPREFTPEKIQGKTIVSTTTNGTRALRACAGAQVVLAASFLNLAATATFLRSGNFSQVLLVCAGTGEGLALEDVLAAGALIEILTGKPPLSPRSGEGEKSGVCLSDSSQIALKTLMETKTDLATAIGSSQNGRRLLAIPELREDVAFCAQRDAFDFVAVMGADGGIRRTQADNR